MIRGYVDEVLADRIRGWAYDTDSDRPVEIRVLLGETEVARSVADVVRDDLRGVLTDDGRCAFDVVLSDPIGAGDLARVTVIADGVELSRSATESPVAASTAELASIQDEYDTRVPAVTNALDIFKGQWSQWSGGLFPGVSNTSQAALYSDFRIEFFDRAAGGFFGRRVLELGPLEAGHTFMMHARGASEIVAVEANTRAFLKCLIVKNLYGLDRARFILGDFSLYLKERRSFDLILASGVLYHMTDPLGVIRNMCRSANVICVYTHYFDGAVMAASDHLRPRFSEPYAEEFEGRSYTVCDQTYPMPEVTWPGYCGGSERKSKWLARDSLLAAFDHCGFDVEIGWDDPSHGHGPALVFVAKRRDEAIRAR